MRVSERSREEDVTELRGDTALFTHQRVFQPSPMVTSFVEQLNGQVPAYKWPK